MRGEESTLCQYRWFQRNCVCLDIYFTSEPNVALGKLRLECCLLVFRHCAIKHINSRLVAGQNAYVVRNIQLALEPIVVQEEVGQIDEGAEFLGQFSCKKMEMSGNMKCMCAGTYELGLELIAV